MMVTKTRHQAALVTKLVKIIQYLANGDCEDMVGDKLLVAAGCLKMFDAAVGNVGPTSK